MRRQNPFGFPNEKRAAKNRIAKTARSRVGEKFPSGSSAKEAKRQDFVAWASGTRGLKPLCGAYRRQ